MILTLTINPAIDRTFVVDKLAFDDRGYILSRSDAAGGRGINAAQVVRAFGGETLALLTSGAKVGQRIEESLREIGLPFEAVRVAAESRINLTISGQQGLTVKLNERGAPLAEVEVASVRDLVQARLKKARWLMICGSIQPGVPDDFYAEVVELAKKHKVKTLVDTDGEALLRAMEAKPALITPNHQEAERLLGRAILTRGQFLEAVTRIHSMGAGAVVLSMGSRGALGCAGSAVFEAVPPRVEALCPIGAGDALAAAFVWAIDRKKPFEDAMRWGVAAGTATAALPGTSLATFEQAEAVYKDVQVHAVS